MTSQETVLISGINGFIGYATAIAALKQGYRVRATARRQEAIDYVKSRGTALKQYEEAGKLEYVILKDIGDKHAFQKAATGCSYIIHIAFPLGNRTEDLHKVAMDGLDALLYAAENTPSIRRIVFTSSTAATTSFSRLLPSDPVNQRLIKGENTDDVPFMSAESKCEPPSKIDDKTPPFVWYQYGKVAATNALREYPKKAPSNVPNTTFDIVILFPGWTLGPNDLAKTRAEAFDYKGTNSFLLFMYQDFNYNPIIGYPATDEPYIPAHYVHLDDVSEGHVNALTVAVKDRLRAFILCSDGVLGPRVDTALDIVKKHFPDEAKRFYDNPRYKTIPVKQDIGASETELLKHPFKSYETAVIDTMGWYSKLPEGSAAGES